jgi:hypothetical protein
MPSLQRRATFSTTWEMPIEQGGALEEAQRAAIERNPLHYEAPGFPTRLTEIERQQI